MVFQVLADTDMSRSDLLIKLVEAGSQNDQSMLERTVAALVAEARAKQHHTLADRLSGVLDQGGHSCAAGDWGHSVA